VERDKNDLGIGLVKCGSTQHCAELSHPRRAILNEMGGDKRIDLHVRWRHPRD